MLHTGEYVATLDEIFDFTSVEIISTLFFIAIIPLLWINFRININRKKVSTLTAKIRNQKVNRYFLIILISSSSLIIFNMYAMALPALVMLILASGGKLSYKIPKFGEISYDVDKFSNEIVAVKAHEVYDEAGILRPLKTVQLQSLSSNMKSTTGLFKSRAQKRSAIVQNEQIHMQNARIRAEQTLHNEKLRADQIKRRSLVNESITAHKSKIRLSLFKAFVFAAILQAIVLIFITPVMELMGFPSSIIPAKRGFVEIILEDFWAYGLIFVFIGIGLYSAQMGIELLMISRLNRPKFIRVGDFPESLTSKIINSIKGKSKSSRTTKNNRSIQPNSSPTFQQNNSSPRPPGIVSTQTPTGMPPMPIQRSPSIAPIPTRPPTGLPQRTMARPPASTVMPVRPAMPMQPPPPVMPMRPAMPMQPPPPVMPMQPAMPMQPPPPVMPMQPTMPVRTSNISQMEVEQQRTQQISESAAIDIAEIEPPLPEEGLPDGWTLEQWKYYGKKWLEMGK